MKNQKTVLITGATGMVGKGVLLECLESDSIGQVVLVGRSRIDIFHSKIREITLGDFSQIA
jgi:FlaA1/EpsC-like NDP-sugar epimerase